MSAVLLPLIGLAVVVSALGERGKRGPRCKHGVLKKSVKTKAGGTRRCKIRS